MTKNERRERDGERWGKRLGIVRELSPQAERHESFVGHEPPPFNPWRALAMVERFVGLPTNLWTDAALEANCTLSDATDPNVRRAHARIWLARR